MIPRTLLGLSLLCLAGCGSDAAAPPSAPAAPEGTAFEYLVSFVPRDSVFGEGGTVQGDGAAWALSSSSAALVIELPVAPVEGTPFGGTSLVIALHQYPMSPGGLPMAGRYRLGPNTTQYDGRAWLRDPARVWATSSEGYLLIEEWDGPTVVGAFALPVEQELVSNAGPSSTGMRATVAGRFQARRSR